VLNPETQVRILLGSPLPTTAELRAPGAREPYTSQDSNRTRHTGLPPRCLRRWIWPERRCSFPTALVIDTLKTPVPAWLHASEASGGVPALVRSIDALVVTPLKAALDDVAWAATLDRVLADWGGLRVALAKAGGEALGVHTIEGATRQGADLPRTLLPEPAHGAAVYAIDLLAWLGEQTLPAVPQRVPPHVEANQSIVQDVAVIELCWLTLVGADRPRMSVAEAAAWEAYSRARSVGASLRTLGLDWADMPRETAGEAAARGLSLLNAVATGWTHADLRAVDEARRREPLSAS
jgi:hypothetical protein